MCVCLTATTSTCAGEMPLAAKHRPLTLTEFIERFGSEDACQHYLRDLRWPDGVRCPKCTGSARSVLRKFQKPPVPDHRSDRRVQDHLPGSGTRDFGGTGSVSMAEGVSLEERGTASVIGTDGP